MDAPTEGIRRVLEVYGVPWWVIHLVVLLVRPRDLRFKFGRRLGGSVRAICGLDMGGGLSPLLFQLAIDPLLFVLCTVPGLDVVQGYADDLSLASVYLAELALAQQLIQRFRLAAGFHMNMNRSVFTRIGT